MYAKTMFAVSIAAAVLGTASQAQANTCTTGQSCKKAYMEEILVTGTRTEQALLYSPNATTLIGEEDIQWNADESLAELLRDVPGLTITDAGQAGMKRLRIRGEESYRVAVLVDGQEITDHRGEGVPLTLDPTLVERIEVVRGAGSVLYGPKALGGVVNFITRKGGDQPLQLSASVSHDTANSGEQYYVSAYGNLAGIDYRLSYSEDEQDDRKTPKGDIENTSAASESASLYLGKRWDNHELALTWDDHNAWSDVFVEDEVRFHFPFTEFAMTIPQRDREKFGLFYTWNNPAEGVEKLHFNAYRQDSDRQFGNYWEQAAFGMEKTTFSESELITDGALAQIDLAATENHYLIAGLQYTADSVEQDRSELLDMGFMTIPTEIYDKASLDTFSLFVQDQWQINESLALTAGVRQYEVDAQLEESTRPGLITPPKDDNEIIASLALTWEIGEGSVLRTSWAEGYMYPSLLNLAIGGIARNFVNPDPNLKPERSDTYELGWRYNHDNLQLDITAFVSETQDYIDHVDCTTDYVSAETVATCVGGTRRSPAEIYVNLDGADTRGLELMGEYKLSEGLELYSSMTWMKRELQLGEVSTYRSGLPTLSSVTGLRYSGELAALGNYWLDFYARGESHSQEYGDAHHNAGWVTANLTAGFEFGEAEQYRVILQAQNLFDNSYSTASENLWAPQRSLIAKLVVNF